MCYVASTGKVLRSPRGFLPLSSRALAVKDANILWGPAITRLLAFLGKYISLLMAALSTLRSVSMSEPSFSISEGDWSVSSANGPWLPLRANQLRRSAQKSCFISQTANYGNPSTVPESILNYM